MVKAACMLLLVEVGLHRVSYQSLVGWIGKQTPIPEDGRCPGSGKDAAALIDEAQRVQTLVGIAANHGLYKANCLRKSITTWWALRKMGLDSAICFGAKKEGGELAAHAWVELHGVPLGERPEMLSTYTAFESSLIDPRKNI